MSMRQWLPIVFVLGLALATAPPLAAGEPRTNEELLGFALRSARKNVEFSSHLPPEEIERRMLDRPCGRETVRTSGVAPVGTSLFVPVSTSVRFSIVQGFNAVDGSRWLLLRGDGSSNFSIAASGIVLSPRADGGSDVRVLKVDRRKLDQVRASVEAGRLFCDWRGFSYRWD